MTYDIAGAGVVIGVAGHNWGTPVPKWWSRRGTVPWLRDACVEKRRVHVVSMHGQRCINDVCVSAVGEMQTCSSARCRSLSFVPILKDAYREAH